MLSQSLKDRRAEAVSPDERIIEGGDEYPAAVVGHELLSVFNAFIESLELIREIRLIFFSIFY